MSDTNDTDAIAAELERLMENADPAPWNHDDEYAMLTAANGDVVCGPLDDMENGNCAFVAAAINALPALLAERREMRERCARLEGGFNEGIEAALHKAEVASTLDAACNGIRKLRLAADPRKAEQPTASTPPPPDPPAPAPVASGTASRSRRTT